MGPLESRPCHSLTNPRVSKTILLRTFAMTKLLSLALLSILACSACSHDNTPACPAGARRPDRVYNPVDGSFERQPPFGRQSNKPVAE